MTDVLAGVTLDHGSPVPLYHQAAQALEAAIRWIEGAGGMAREGTDAAGGDARWPLDG